MRGLAFALALLAGSLASPPAGAQAPGQAAPARDHLSAVAAEVAADVEKLRGWAFTRPVRQQRTTIAEARRYFARRIDLALPAARRPLVQAFLQAAGLVPVGCDLAASLAAVLDEQVVGYYDPEAATLYLVDRPEPMPAFIERAVLAHELTHALDDQHVGLGPLSTPDPRRTEDADLVLSALSEGSASALMLQYLVQQTTAGKVDAGEAARFLAAEMARAKTLGEVPRYFSAMFASYVTGAAFLARGDAQGALSAGGGRATGESFRTAWKTLPRSSEQILHPEKYWDGSRRDEPVEVDDRAVERWLASPGRQVVHRDTLGEVLTALLTGPRGTSPGIGQAMAASAWTNAGAAGWGGDRFFLLADGPTVEDATRGLANVKGVWVTAWDSEKDRDEFVAALEAGNPPPGHVTMAHGERLALVFSGFTRGECDGLMTRLDGSSALTR